VIAIPFKLFVKSPCKYINKYLIESISFWVFFHYIAKEYVSEFHVIRHSMSLSPCIFGFIFFIKISILKITTSIRKLSFSVKSTNTKSMSSRAPVTHTCNPRYSEGRDQKDCGLKLAQENSS
jgi:hypothetical protein